MTHTVVFDLGQFSTKIGFGGENDPRHTFYTICGVPKYSTIGVQQSKQIYVGNEVSDSLGLYKITFPIEKGNIVDWPMFEALIDYCFYSLRIDPTTINVLYTIDANLPRETRKNLFKIFLEKHQISGFYPVPSALLTMYSGGFSTGLVVDIGAAFIRITPIFEGYILKHAIKYLDLGGSVLDHFMKKLVSKLGFNAETSAQKELIRVLKERACYCSLNYEEERKKIATITKSFAFPDGNEITIGEERFLVPELMFRPELNELEIPPINKAIVDCIFDCDIDIRSKLLEQIFLTGGGSMFLNLDIRLKVEIEKELEKRKASNQNVHIIAPKERFFSNWVGGSILSMIPEFQSSWVSRSDYFRSGIPENLLE